MTPLINKLLNELKTNEEARDRANNLHVYNCMLLHDNQVYHNGRLWHELNTSTQSIVIMAMLSKGVMEFLDVPIKEFVSLDGLVQRAISNPNWSFLDWCSVANRRDNLEDITLGAILYFEFTNALYVGKTLEEAIQIIEEIYAEYTK